MKKQFPYFQSAVRSERFAALPRAIRTKFPPVRRPVSGRDPTFTVFIGANAWPHSTKFGKHRILFLKFFLPRPLQDASPPRPLSLNAPTPIPPQPSFFLCMHYWAPARTEKKNLSLCGQRERSEEEEPQLQTTTTRNKLGTALHFLPRRESQSSSCGAT